MKKAQKIFTLLIMIAFLTNYFFHGLIPVHAVTYKITTDIINFRTAPTTNNNEDGSSNIIMELDMGTIVEFIEETGNWSKIKYNDTIGYVSSKYLGHPNEDSYLRPWNTPKKAILGGAKWIASGYIARGQYTSYLKKFNVNPNSLSEILNHQYMENIHAPSSEAKTSYNAYKNNGLLEVPLVFSIPVYLNMADKYDSPAGNIDVINAIDNVIDPEFEKLLDAELFPESYKRILRYLHSIHPNWTFKALHTNLDFTYAVNVEKNVGATQYSALYERDANGNPISSEPGWYRPNFAGTAYYMDPRNFLSEKYILQFEALNYNQLYTEDVVQSIIQNSFMKDISIKDNQTYKSIFVEVGQQVDISPVYLASLALQESGTKGSIATSGETFEYEGRTYQSVYNFFNIGANSSASNPVREGLKYATGGYCTICGDYTPPESSNPNNNNPIIPPPTVIVPSATTSMNNIGVKLTNNYIRGFNIGSSIASLKTLDNNITYSNDDVIKTGTILKFADGQSFSAVVLGDLSGDGQINSADILKIRLHLLNTNPLTGAYKEAADVNNDGQINSADLLLIRQYLLGKSNINQL